MFLLLVFKENGYTFRKNYFQIRNLGGLFIRFKFNSHNLQGLSASDI